MLSVKDLEKITHIVTAQVKQAVDLLQPKAQPTVENQPDVVYAGKDAEAMDDTEELLYKQLANPRIVLYRGKNGRTLKVNETVQSLNALLDYRKNKKEWRDGVTKI